ncbi:GAP family protein [Actinopolymorpha pittospori]
MADLLLLLPFALVMVAGPQLISAVLLTTNPRWRSDSLAYVAGAALSVTAVCTIGYFAADLVRSAYGTTEQSAARRGINLAILVLLLFAMIHVFARRGRPDPPAWMGRLQTAGARFSFGLGFLLLGLFPSDLVTSLTVGLRLATEGGPWWYLLPFVALTLLLLALPALTVLALGERGRAMLPRVRDWMNRNSWVVSEIVLLIFVVLTVQKLV